MRAIDTNIVIRFLTDDDADQSRRARDLIVGGDLFVSTTVILETEWALRTAYRLPRPAVVRLIETFAGLPGVIVEEPERLSTALDWAASGMDLADALHLAGARGCTAFVSFDRALARSAAEVRALPVVEP